MNLIKVNASEVLDFEKNNNFILVSIQTDFNYYLVNEHVGYETVESVPYGENIPNMSYDLVLEQVSNMSNMKTQTEIQKLENQLNSSDYKIIKDYEYSLVGLEQPYAVDKLHAERQAIRDKINALQESIKAIKTWEELDNVIMKNKGEVDE